MYVNKRGTVFNLFISLSVNYSMPVTIILPGILLIVRSIYPGKKNLNTVIVFFYLASACGLMHSFMPQFDQSGSPPPSPFIGQFKFFYIR